MARVFPHGPLEELADGVWLVKGSLPFPLHRNMVVLRLADGGLLLHSPVAMDEAGLKALDAAGPVRWVLVPSASHKMDAPFYRERYPDAQVICPDEIRSAVTALLPVSNTVEEALPALGFRLHKVPSVKMVEYAYEYPLPSGERILLFNDAFGGANAYADNFVGRFLVKPLGIKNDIGVAKFIRFTQVRDLGALQRFAHELADIPDLRLVTVSHGDPITSRPAEALRALV